MKASVMIAVLLLLISCDSPEQTVTSNTNYSVYVQLVRGHDYVIVQGVRSISALHAEHCQCKQEVTP